MKAIHKKFESAGIGAHILPMLLIAILGAAIYSNSLKGEFLLDDHQNIVRNEFIKSGLTVPNILFEDIVPSGIKKISFYRPIPQISYRVDYAFWRLNETGYHITNTLLHLCAALAVYGLVLTLFGSGLLPLLAGLLFVSHPVQVETVAYISDRSDIFVALFIFLSAIFYIKRSRGEAPTRNMTWAVVCLVAALLSKESALIFPALLAAYHIVFRKKIQLSVFLPFVVLPAAYVAGRLWLFESAALSTGPASTVFQRLPGFFASIPSYLRLLVLPVGLHMDYGNELLKFSDPRAIAGGLLLAASLGYVFVGVIKKRYGKAVLFSVSWFFLSLLPVSNIYPLFSYMAEHFLYMPSLGFCVILAWGLKWLTERPGEKALAVCLALLILFSYSVMAFRQNVYWRDPVAMYKKTLVHNPQSVCSIVNLSNLLKERNNYAGALKLMERAVELAPSNAVALNDVGLLYAHMGNVEKAMKSYDRAILINPKMAPAYNNIGILCQGIGLNEKAEAAYKKAIEVNPRYAMAYNNLGALYGNMGRHDEAVPLYKKAIAADPDDAMAYNNLGKFYLIKEDYGEAIKYCDRAIRLGRADETLIKALKPRR